MSPELVFLLEEPSMKAFLEELLPRIVPGTSCRLVPHEGKLDLEKSVPRKLRAWRSPGVRFIVVRDQDSEDCRALKKRLVSTAEEAGRPDTVIRIVCRELEAWLLGDLVALGTAFDAPHLESLRGKAKFRNPDGLGNPSEEIRKLVSRYQKISGARAVGRHIDPSRNVSPSFQVFVTTVQLIADTPVGSEWTSRSLELTQRLKP
jgi:hypothetical protein